MVLQMNQRKRKRKLSLDQTNLNDKKSRAQFGFMRVSLSVNRTHPVFTERGRGSRPALLIDDLHPFSSRNRMR